MEPGGPFEQRLRRGEGLATQRDLRGALERPGGLPAGADGGRLPEVLGHDLRRVVGVADRGDDGLGRAQVQPGATQRRQARGERLAHEGVREPQRARRGLRHVEQAVGQRRLQRVEALLDLGRRDGADELDVDLAPQHRCRLEEPLRRLRQPCEASGEHVPDPGRDRGCGHRVGPELALLDEQPRELGGEERVALRPCVQGSHDVPVDRTAGGLREQLAGLRQGQPAQRQPAGAGSSAQLRQGADERVVTGDLEVAHGGDDQDGGGSEPRCDAGEQVEARGIGPLQVVDEQHQARAAGEQGDRLRDAVRDGRRDRRRRRAERGRAGIALEHRSGGPRHRTARRRRAEQLQPRSVGR